MIDQRPVKFSLDIDVDGQGFNQKYLNSGEWSSKPNRLKVINIQILLKR
jgi:hypothetical protein